MESIYRYYEKKHDPLPEGEGYGEGAVPIHIGLMLSIKHLIGIFP